ncbi:glycosyltransferase family 9 protein [uncultured Enterobacter sp.]|uniref:glycosyltransferase family 9 protein n=1 Tax=uncultured Enterobacter sp. TaxID=238202 RepID=UPI00261DC12A|nr:glycosyltransferase family 9 protein [uncultured Enterobacter sp.]
MKIRIFIETTQSNFCHQVANCLHSADAEEWETIFVLKHKNINTQAIPSCRISEIAYKDGDLNDTLISLANTLNHHDVETLEVHVEASTASLALVIFSTFFKRNIHIIKPHIYETSIRDYALRVASDSNTALRKKLSEAVIGNKGFTGNSAELMRCGYLWHHFLDAAYYIKKRDTAARDLPIKTIPALSDEQKRRFLAIFRIPETMFATVKEMFAQENVYYCSRIAPRHPMTAEVHRKALHELLLKIRNRRSESSLFLLSHQDNDAALLQPACDYFHQLPTCLSPSALQWLGIHPKNIISTLDDDLSVLDNPGERHLISTKEEDELPIPEEALTTTFNLPHENIHFTHEIERWHREGNAKRIFYSSASMGDIVYGLGAINALRKRFPEDKFVFVTHKLYRDLIDNSPSGVEHWDIHALTPEQYFEIEVANRFSLLHFFERWQQIVAACHMTDAFISEVTRDALDTDKGALLDFDAIDKAPVEKFMRDNHITSGKVALLHPNLGAPNRTWTKQHWQKLAERFVFAGWQVIFIGSDKNKYQSKKTMPLEIPGTFNAINAFSITQTIYLMSLCQLLVACDSGPVALAGYTDIAISALYSIIPSQYRLPYRHTVLGWNAQGINVGCQYGQCGHLIMNEKFFKQTLHKKWALPNGQQFAEWCPNGKKYACLSHFSDADWWAHIEEFINSDDFIMNTPSF